MYGGFLEIQLLAEGFYRNFLYYLNERPWMTKLILVHLTFLLAGFLGFCSIVYAGDIIPLSITEKQLLGQGELVSRELDSAEKGGATIEVVGLINAPRVNIVQVLTSFEQYPEFMPNVSLVEIIEQDSIGSILNFTLALPLGIVKKYRILISVTELSDQFSKIAWYSLEWPDLRSSETIKETTGYWLIEEKTDSRSLVLYHVFTDPGPIPFGLGWIVDILTKDSVPGVLLGTKSQAEAFVGK